MRKDTKRTAAKKKAFLLSEVSAILLISAALFLLLTDVGLMGGIGSAIRMFEKGLFGQAYILFAVFLVVFAALAYFGRGKYLRKFKLLSLSVAFLCITALFELMFSEGTGSTNNNFFEYYSLAAAGAHGGGAIGGALTGGLRSVLGYVGAYFVLIVILVICIVILTEKSFVSAAKSGADKTLKAAGRSREKYCELVEERRKRKEEYKTGKSSPTAVTIGDESNQAGAGQSLQPDSYDPEIYLKYGREIIGGGQPGVKDLQNVREPLVRRRYQPRTDISGAGLDTEVIPPYQDAGVKKYPVNIKQLNYDDDSVPFTETKEEKYKSYAGILLAGSVSAENAGAAGFAAGNTYDAGISGDDHFAVSDPINLVHDDSGTDAGISETDGSEPSVIKIHDAFETADFADEVSSGQETDADDIDARFEPRPHDNDSPESPSGAGRSAGSRAGKTEAQFEGAALTKRPYIFPKVKLLSRGSGSRTAGRDEILENADKLERVLRNFGVGVTVTNIIRGPRVSRYELIPDTGVKVSRITSLEGDIKLALAASELRIEAPIPGKSAVGIEVPNSESRTVRFRDICESEEFKNAGSPLSWGIGLDIQGLPVIGDISTMPHVLVAGTTGSGKSVGINTLIMSILYKSTPEEVRMILIDPKVVELSVYNGIPHLLTEVVTKPERALSALNWAVAEMNNRYRLFRETATRNISGYNEKIERMADSYDCSGTQETAAKLPYILIIIDELSELMMHSKKDVEQAIVSLSQLARAAGIHLVVATQRPSVDVVTGLIKSNIPSRIAYRLPSAVDSRTILDSGGAETLLGNGDMLYKPGNKNAPERVQGAFLSDDEVETVVKYVKRHNCVSDDLDKFDEAVNTQLELDLDGLSAAAETPQNYDEYFADAGRLIINSGKASIGALQRKFKVGFNRAARIMDQLHEAGVVGDSEGTKERRILMDIKEFEEYLNGVK